MLWVRDCCATILEWLERLNLPGLRYSHSPLLSSTDFRKQQTVTPHGSLSLGQECLAQEETKLQNGLHGHFKLVELPA
jgi:hypothetical protein